MGKSTVQELSADATLGDRDDGWTNQFNGRDLTGWTVQSTRASVRVADNAIVASSADNTGWIATEREFSDFELELDFQLAPGGNSGVFLRIPDTGAPSGGDFLEVQLIDDAAFPDSQPWQRTGSIYGVAGPSQPANLAVDEWHTVFIRADGPEITVSLDGREINRVNVNTALMQGTASFTHLKRPSGHIGLQLRRQAIWFRYIRVRELDATTADVVP